MKRVLQTASLFILICLSSHSYAGSPKSNIDSLLALVKTDKSDSNKIDHFKWLCWYFRIIGKMDTAIKLGNEGADIAKRAGNEKGLASCYCALGLVYWNEGNYSVALDHFFKSLKIDESIRYTPGIGANTADIGNIYATQGDYVKSIEYYFKSLKIDEDYKDSIGLQILEQNIGESYEQLKDTAKALKYLFQALQVGKKINYVDGIAGCMNSIGNVYYDIGNYTKAMEYFTNEEKISIDAGDKIIILNNLGDIGKTLMQQKNYNDAKTYFLKAISLADSIHYLEGIRNYGKSLSDLYALMGNWEDAFKAHQDYTKAKDSLFSIEKNKQITSNELNYAFEKKEALLRAEQDEKDTVAKEEKKKQRIILYAVSSVLLLVILLAGFILSGYKQKQKANQLLEEQKKKVDTAFLSLRIKHKEITDSISYAQRIQQALFKDEEDANIALPKHSILFKPRNVVSGDFYWRYEKDDCCYLAAVDCTGHGVPGAFLTMLGSAFLNEICATSEPLSPAEILNRLKDKVVKELSAHGEVKDGMDISLCKINQKNNEIEWAGANNPLWYLHNGILKDIIPDKQPIGYHEVNKPFTNHVLSLNKNDILYLFTDGYADQFGGPKGKKFKYNNLKETIKGIANLPITEQKARLNEVFEQWRGDLEQVDDVLVIFVQV